MTGFQRKIGFIGAGNMSQAMISAWVEQGIVATSDIFVTNRTEGKLQKVIDQYKIQGLDNNEELVDRCDIVVLAVKPQDLIAAIEPVSTAFDADKLVVSLAAGISTSRIKKLIPNAKNFVRVMPNTPVKLRQGVTGYYAPSIAPHWITVVEALLEPLGLVIRAEDEDMFSSLAVACSSGVGFVFELMLYWQEWLEEHGFSANQAREMTVQTFLGASRLAQSAPGSSLEDLQARVASKKGITQAGLDSMRELEVERVLRYSFEKAALRDQEIAREQDGA